MGLLFLLLIFIYIAAVIYPTIHWYLNTKGPATNKQNLILYIVVLGIIPIVLLPFIMLYG